MTKSDLIDSVAQRAEISKFDAGKAVSGMIDSITAALAKGETVTLVGFGTFSVNNRAARTGRNPRTGSPLSIPASKAPKFKAGKSLKDAVNN